MTDLKTNHKIRLAALEDGHRVDMENAKRVHAATVAHEQELGKSLRNVWDRLTGA